MCVFAHVQPSIDCSQAGFKHLFLVTRLWWFHTGTVCYILVLTQTSKSTHGPWTHQGSSLLLAEANWIYFFFLSLLFQEYDYTHTHTQYTHFFFLNCLVKQWQSNWVFTGQNSKRAAGAVRTVLLLPLSGHLQPISWAKIQIVILSHFVHFDTRESMLYIIIIIIIFNMPHAQRQLRQAPAAPWDPSKR